MFFETAYKYLNEDFFMRCVSDQYHFSTLSIPKNDPNYMPRIFHGIPDSFVAPLISSKEWASISPQSREYIIKNLLEEISRECYSAMEMLKRYKIESNSNFDLAISDVRERIARIEDAISQRTYFQSFKSPLLQKFADLKEEMNLQFGNNNLVANAEKSNKVVMNEELTKIVWTGEVGVLGKVFHEFCRNLKNKEGKPLIASNSTDVARMLENVFVNENGEQFSYQTLYKYVNESGKKSLKGEDLAKEVYEKAKNH